MTAFGRSDVPEDFWFEANDIRYVSFLEDDDLNEDAPNIEDAYYFTIADTLSKKGNIAHFIHPDKKGNTKWRHAIVLEKSGKFTDKTQHFIELIDSRGGYPSKNTKNMDDFTKRLK